jgi:osmoprotectant transport system ATP-binding protein
MSAVEFRSAGFKVGARKILDNFQLNVETGETLVLLGRSGSGKTTALKMVNGLNRASAGAVVVEGRPVADWDPIALKRNIGYVIQESGLFPHFTVARNIGLVPKLLGWEAARIDERVGELLEVVGMPPREFADRYPRQLSGGQRQRVGVARALAADPPLLLFDEPFGALDPISRVELQREFLRLRDKFHKTSLFVTHDVREAMKLGTRIALVNEGQVAFTATPEEFRRTSHPQARAFLDSLE